MMRTELRSFKFKRFTQNGIGGPLMLAAPMHYAFKVIESLISVELVGLVGVGFHVAEVAEVT